MVPAKAILGVYKASTPPLDKARDEWVAASLDEGTEGAIVCQRWHKLTEIALMDNKEIEVMGAGAPAEPTHQNSQAEVINIGCAGFTLVSWVNDVEGAETVSLSPGDDLPTCREFELPCLIGEELAPVQKAKFIGIDLLIIKAVSVDLISEVVLAVTFEGEAKGIPLIAERKVKALPRFRETVDTAPLRPERLL